MGRRNWCAVDWDRSNGNLHFSLQIEKEKGHGATASWVVRRRLRSRILKILNQLSYRYAASELVPQIIKMKDRLLTFFWPLLFFKLVLAFDNSCIFINQRSSVQKVPGSMRVTSLCIIYLYFVAFHFILSRNKHLVPKLFPGPRDSLALGALLTLRRNELRYCGKS